MPPRGKGKCIGEAARGKFVDVAVLEDTFIYGKRPVTVSRKRR